jgi:hypothetical protein
MPRRPTDAMSSLAAARKNLVRPDAVVFWAQSARFLKLRTLSATIAMLIAARAATFGQS